MQEAKPGSLPVGRRSTMARVLPTQVLPTWPWRPGGVCPWLGAPVTSQPQVSSDGIGGAWSGRK